MLTTLPVANLAEAVVCLRWYRDRWLIERYHFVLNRGCGVEALQLETAQRLERALATYCIVAWRLLWLTYLARAQPELSCTQVLEHHEWQALSAHHHRSLELPTTPPTLHEAVRWIAQLGGFLGRRRDGEPGVKTLWRGWSRFHDIATTWQLLHASSPRPVDISLMGKA